MQISEINLKFDMKIIYYFYFYFFNFLNSFTSTFHYYFCSSSFSPELYLELYETKHSLIMIFFNLFIFAFFSIYISVDPTICSMTKLAFYFI